MGNGHVRLLLIDRTKQKQNDADEENNKLNTKSFASNYCGKPVKLKSCSKLHADAVHLLLFYRFATGF